MNAYLQLLSQIENQQQKQYRQAVETSNNQSSRQQRYATILGTDASTGQVVVQVGASGPMLAASLSTAYLPVGAVRSLFASDGISNGFVDAIGP
jgi:topoisomerase IA-like protein